MNVPPLRTALALSHLDDVGDALVEAASRARAELGETPAFCLVACTPDRAEDPDRLEEGLAAAFDATPHVGTSSARIGVADSFHTERTVAVLAVAGPLVARAFVAPAPEGHRDLELARVLDSLGGRTGSVVAFADPRGPQGPLLPKLLERLAPGASVAGGGSTGKDLFQLADGLLVRGACAGLAIELLASRAGTFVAQGGELFGGIGRITKCEGGKLLEVDGKPAVNLLEPVKADPPGGSLEAAAVRLSVALAPGGPEALARGEFVVRNLSGVDPKTKALAVAARLEEGWGVSLLLREAIAARTQVAGQARQLRAALGQVPAGGVYFDCASRGAELYGFDGVDERQIHKALGEFPLLSVQCSFEMGPLFEHDRARPELQLYSGVLWSLASL